jgi:hypothetical protein
MSLHRFFDIVVENDLNDQHIDQEFVLELPEHDMDTAVERQEFLGIMFDTLTAASGLNVVSFSSEQIPVLT